MAGGIHPRTDVGAGPAGYVAGMARGGGGERGGPRVVLRRLRGLAGGVVEMLVPVGTGLFLAALVLDVHTPPIPAALELVGVLVGLGQGVALFWRRTHPRIVMAITAGGSLVVLDVAPDALFPYAAMFALWSLAAAEPPRISLPGLAATLAVTLPAWPTAAPGEIPFVLVVVVAVWALGEATRNRLAASEQRARRAVDAEHARLARELHDVIAHSVSVMVVQAAAADDIFDTDPARARGALHAIEASGRDAMAELRRLLAALGPAPESVVARPARPGSRPAAVDPGPAASERRPAPGLDRLDDLVGPVRALGLAVDLRHERVTAAPVPAGVGLSAYRIVQEALTNTVRHARARRVEVVVRADDTAVEVSVVDDGQGCTGVRGCTGRQGCTGVQGCADGPVNGGGRGIAGMRERAALLGGSLDAGPRPEGGFGVRAVLPLEATR